MHAHQQQMILYDGKNPIFCSFAWLTSDLQSLKKNCYSTLHSSELDYFETLAFEKRQHSYLLGRYCAKQALIAQGSFVDPRHITFKQGVFYHPIVENNSALQVSWSHSESCAVAITFLEEYFLGIDLEKIESNKNLFIHSQMTTEELQLIKRIERSARSPLTLFWTIKEALAKALKIGFTSPLEIFAIKSIQIKGDVWQSTFKLFPQYQAISFTLDLFYCSIAYPMKIEPFLNIQKLKSNIKSLLTN